MLCFRRLFLHLLPLNCVPSVSYTHLDVYKRQAFYWSPYNADLLSPPFASKGALPVTKNFFASTWTLSLDVANVCMNKLVHTGKLVTIYVSSEPCCKLGIKYSVVIVLLWPDLRYTLFCTLQTCSRTEGKSIREYTTQRKANIYRSKTDRLLKQIVT